MSILHIQQVGAHVQRKILPHLDLTDVSARNGDMNSAGFARGLAALAVQVLAGFDAKSAASCVIDGFQDNGIDAIAVDEGQSRIIIVQSKWRTDGRKSIDQGEALKLVQGAKDLFSQKFNLFNARARRLQGVIENALINPEVRITIAVATTGPSALPTEVQRPLQDLLIEVNGGDDLDDLVDLRVLGLAELHNFLTDRTSRKKLDLDLRLSEWGSVQTPYQAYYGLVPAREVAAWYDKHGEGLFDGNIRQALGRTAVNEALVATLRNEPYHFWYFNNGITVLAEGISRAAKDSHSRTIGIFRLAGATVVNGAQTAASIHAVMQEDETLLEDAEIWIRVIGLEGCPEGFAASVTRATNTQNGVDARDFVALDPNQDFIREQLLLQFDKTYGVKRGADPVVGGSGCGVEEAAVALACAHSDPAYAVDAKRQVSVLWASTDDPVYRALFPRDLNISRLWNSVLALRTIDAELARLRNIFVDSRSAGVLVHGNRLIAHLTFSQLGSTILDDPAAESKGLLVPAAELTMTLSSMLGETVDARFPGAFLAPLFKNHTKCRELVAETLSRYTGSPVYLPEQRPAKSSTAARDRLPRSGRRSPSTQRPSARRKQDAVKIIQAAAELQEDALLRFRPDTKREEQLLVPWVAEEPARGRARWTNQPPAVYPLIWEVDGERYSPSNLVTTMMIAAGYPPPSGVRGTTRWSVGDRGTLSDIADEITSSEPDPKDRRRLW